MEFAWSAACCPWRNVRTMLVRTKTAIVRCSKGSVVSPTIEMKYLWLPSRTKSLWQLCARNKKKVQIKNFPKPRLPRKTYVIHSKDFGPDENQERSELTSWWLEEFQNIWENTHGKCKVYSPPAQVQKPERSDVGLRLGVTHAPPPEAQGKESDLPS